MAALRMGRVLSRSRYHVVDWIVTQRRTLLGGYEGHHPCVSARARMMSGTVECRDGGMSRDESRGKNRINHKSKRPPMFLYGSSHGGDDANMLALGKVHCGDRVMLSGDESRHARTVLRLAHGSDVQLCDGHGVVVGGQVEYDGEVDVTAIRGKKRNKGKSTLGSQSVYIRVVEEPIMHSMPLRQWHVAVACGSLKGGRSDWLIEKCAEVGAHRLTPLLTDRSPDVKREADRWERLTVSVMKQSSQPFKMELCAPCRLDVFLESMGDSCAFVGAEGAPLTFGSALDKHNESKSSESVLIIGPEGDFTPEELECIQQRGVVPVTMGSRRLRTETAAIAMLSYATIHTET